MLNIAYQGIPGCYSQQALHTFFPNMVKTISKLSFNEVFSSLTDQSSDAGLIPIENCLGGSILENYDLFAKYDIIIRAEFCLKIKHCLLANKETNLENIKKVVSHPQALSQCQNSCEMLGLIRETLYDTAGSAKFIKDNKLLDVAAIASINAAEYYDLQVLEEEFGDNKNCFTRFLLITSATNFNINDKIDKLVYPNNNGESNNKTNKHSIIIGLPHSAGSLVKILNIFSLYNVSLTKIESRPNRGNIYENENDKVMSKVKFKYLFYLDFIINESLTFQNSKSSLPITKRIYQVLRDHVDYLKILGSYPENNYIYNPNKRLNIAIVGFGRFGQFVAEKLVKNNNIFVTSRSNYTEKCQQIGAKYYENFRSLSNDNKIDILLISVSINSFRKVLDNLVSETKDRLENLLVIDVLSVKDYPRKLLLEKLPKSCDILATHPMFGPDSCPSTYWLDQPMVYEKIRITNQERYSLFMESIEECNLIRLNCDKHDYLAAKSQFLTHLIGQLLHLQKSESTLIDTKSFSLLLELKEIIGNDSEELFLGLYRYNNYTKSQLDIFIKNIDYLKELLTS